MEKLRDLLTKAPWKEYRPAGRGAPLSFDPVTQDDFIRQYYPSSHIIYDEVYYPNILKEVEVPVYDEDGAETGSTQTKRFLELVPRHAFAFQQLVTLKQLIHVTGNDIQFDINSWGEATEGERNELRKFRMGWSQAELEHAVFKFVQSVKRTGDGALVGYMSRGKFGVRSLSYFDGDSIYPQYDSVTGELTGLARSYYGYDNEGQKVTEFVEVWDDTYLWRYRRDADGSRNIVQKVLGAFGLYGYTLVSRQEHGFPFCPIVYYRDPVGACWTPAQKNCDAYDLAFSKMSQNNDATGLPIMMLQGDNVDVASYDLNGSIKTLTMGPDDKAGFIHPESASDSYTKELETQYQMIYRLCSIVEPPELKSGDLPAAALKILYSPAVEKAMSDAQEYDPSLDRLVEIAKWGIGIEQGDTIGLRNLPIKAWIKPYVHLNESSIVSDLATAVQNQFLSRRTASEVISFYAVSDEWERVMTEKKKEQESDLLTNYEKKRFSDTDESVQG